MRTYSQLNEAEKRICDSVTAPWWFPSGGLPDAGAVDIFVPYQGSIRLGRLSGRRGRQHIGGRWYRKPNVERDRPADAQSRHRRKASARQRSGQRLRHEQQVGWLAEAVAPYSGNQTVPKVVCDAVVVAAERAGRLRSAIAFQVDRLLPNDQLVAAQVRQRGV